MISRKSGYFRDQSAKKVRDNRKTYDFLEDPELPESSIEKRLEFGTNGNGNENEDEIPDDEDGLENDSAAIVRTTA